MPCPACGISLLGVRYVQGEDGLFYCTPGHARAGPRRKVDDGGRS